MIAYPIVIVISYFIGTIPVGLLAGKLTKGVDIRRHGSGKVGTTNVLRTIGRPAAVIVLLLDMGKGMSVIFIARAISHSVGLEPLAAMAVLLGHNWPVFTRFQGGRGTAPGLGGLLILSPWAGLVALAAAFPVLLKTRYMSLGSLVGAAIGGLTLIIFSLTGIDPVADVAFGVFAIVVITFSHRDNIGRILDGTERKIGAPAEHFKKAEMRVENSGKGA